MDASPQATAAATRRGTDLSSVIQLLLHVAIPLRRRVTELVHQKAFLLREVWRRRQCLSCQKDSKCYSFPPSSFLPLSTAACDWHVRSRWKKGSSNWRRWRWSPSKLWKPFISSIRSAPRARSWRPWMPPSRHCHRGSDSGAAATAAAAAACRTAIATTRHSSEFRRSGLWCIPSWLQVA